MQQILALIVKAVVVKGKTGVNPASHLGSCWRGENE